MPRQNGTELAALARRARDYLEPLWIGFLCGPWSSVLPSDAQPSLTFALPSRLWDEATRTWSWTAPPDNSGLPAAFRCGGESGPNNGRPAQTATTCQVPEAGPGDRVWLDVDVAGVVARYWNR